MVDWWRVMNPLDHTDHEVDYCFNFLDMDKGTPTEADLQRNFDRLKQYDLIVTSYFTNPATFAFLMAVEEHGGPKLVMDVDDYLFNVNEKNPYKQNVPEQFQWTNRVIVQEFPRMTTTRTVLKDKLAEHRTNRPASSVHVVPNYIDLNKYDHKPHHNGDKIIIGFFGSPSHVHDLETTGVMDALGQILQNYPQVELHTVGIKLGDLKGTGRYSFHKPQGGKKWWRLWKSLRFDIALAPLTSEEFNLYKSDIKWQESSMMGAAFVGSDFGAYHETVRNGVDGLLVQNNANWYEQLEKLVTDAGMRRKLVSNAQERIRAEFSIDNHRDQLTETYERIAHE